MSCCLILVAAVSVIFRLVAFGFGFCWFFFFHIGEITHRDVKPLPNDYSTASHPSAGTNSLHGKYGIQDVLGMGKCKPQAWAHTGRLEPMWY